MVWSDDVFANEVQPEWRQALPGIIAGRPDRTDLMTGCKRIVKGPVTVSEIIAAVSAETDIPAQEITGPRSTERAVWGRRMAMRLAHDLCPDLTYAQISWSFKREQSTAALAVKRAQGLLDTNAEFAHCYQHARWRLGYA